VVVTPHLGASTVEAQDRAGTDVAASVLKALAGDFVPDAVNVSGGKVSEEVALWLNLATKLGAVASKLLDGAPATVVVTARGEPSSECIDALGLAALRGAVCGVLDEQGTLVNAPSIAEQRGGAREVNSQDESVTRRSGLHVKFVAA